MSKTEQRRTAVTLVDQEFYINGQPTYKGIAIGTKRIKVANFDPTS